MSSRSRNPNYLPQYGAIFMANNSTRKECFERELFGLPYEYADFVRQVKTGILLFLFDFQERQLYGVFEATSDGMMNIIPDAYKSKSNKKFPAQVRFSTLWHCDPLPEAVFCDAIKENYFKRSKFNFGLSRHQVGRLLCLFQKKILNIPSPPVRERHEISSQVEKSVVVTNPNPLENLESMQESIPEVEDYIPLPSIEPDEIDDPFDVFLRDAGLSSLCSLAVGGTDDEKKVDSGFPVQGLYSDKHSDKQRTSAFLRLSGLGKVLADEHHHSMMDNPREILKGMDERHKMWKCKSTENSSISRVSVFSRLNCNVGKALESQQKVRVITGAIKPMNVAKELTCQNLKSKSSCCMKSLKSVKNIGKNFDSPGKRGSAQESQQKVTGIAGEEVVDVVKEFIHQTLKRKRSRLSTSSPSDVPDHSEETAQLTVHDMKYYE